MAEHRDKRPVSRHAYVKDFKADDSGKYSYQGATLHSSKDLAAFQKEIRGALTAFASVLVVQIAAGCIPGTGMEGHLLMLLPYALGIGCSARILWILGRLLQNGTSLREYVYKATAEKLDGYLMVAQILPAIVVLDAVVCLIRGTLHFQVPGLLVLIVSQALLLLAALLTKRRKPAGTWSENAAKARQTTPSNRAETEINGK